MKSFNMKRICTLLCAIVFSSALFADLDSADQLVAQSSKGKKKSRNNNAQRNPNTWRPYYLNLKVVEPTLTSFYQQNVGVGFLYFSTINGNLELANGGVRTPTKLRGHISYNRTPLFEAVVGRDIFRWWKIGLSYQHQGGVAVQTAPQAITSNNLPVDMGSLVRLDAVMFKTYVMLPWVLVWKNVYHEPYLGLAVGPGWQSWVNTLAGGQGVFLRQKYSANCVFTIDLGFKLRKALPSYIMSFVVGCKYNEWGQARSIGKLQQQYTLGGAGLINPVRIKTVYQFAPYLGVQFNF